MFKRVVQQSFRYGSWAMQGVSHAETGDTEALVQETVAAGATVTFPVAVVASNAQAMGAECVPATASIATNAGDTLLPAGGIGVAAWARASGDANPFATGDAVSVTVDNSAGTEAVKVFLGVLIETP